MTEIDPQDTSGPEDELPDVEEDDATPFKSEPIEPQKVDGAEDLPDDVKSDPIPDGD